MLYGIYLLFLFANFLLKNQRKVLVLSLKVKNRQFINFYIL